MSYVPTDFYRYAQSNFLAYVSLSFLILKMFQKKHNCLDMTNGVHLLKTYHMQCALILKYLKS